ncbi:MAG: hypothetical protein RR543_02510 [Erysipelotrichales bacterium]
MYNFTRTQDKFVQKINNSKSMNRFPHAMLIESSNSLLLDKAIEYTIASLLCEQVAPCFDCDVCQRVLDHNISDVIVYDLSDETLKKEYILELQQRFSKTALESTNKQVYVIKYIENATSIALNALLKFLEEPNDNVHAIFTTKNTDRVLNTIVSRSSVYQLRRNDVESIKEVFYENFQKEYVDTALLITSDEVYLDMVLKSEIFNTFVKNTNRIYKAIYSDICFLEFNQLLNDAEKDELSIFFELFYSCLVNIEYLEILGVEEAIINKIKNNTQFDSMLDVILSARLSLSTNMNKALLIDRFSVEIEEVRS